MGIYINGIEMPKEIEPALVIDFCEDLDGKRYARFYHYRYGGLTDWHEVLEFHEPHGRLGDLDKLEKMFADIDSAPYSCFDGAEPFYSAEDAVQIIRLAPTVIDAEEAIA